MRAAVPLLLLHDVYIPAWFAPLILAAVLGAVAQVVLLLARNYRGNGPRLRPPPPFKQMRRLAAVPAVLLGIAAAIWSRDGGAGVVVGLLVFIAAMGVAAIAWMVSPWNRSSEATASSCEQCRMAAAAGGVAPLVKKAHNATGPRFLYQCGACHAYWEKDVKGLRPISMLDVRLAFPAYD